MCHESCDGCIGSANTCKKCKNNDEYVNGDPVGLCVASAKDCDNGLLGNLAVDNNGVN